jgi:hypothetical protein
MTMQFIIRSPTYILHLFHLEDTSLLFLFISESVKVRFLPRVDSFSFAQEPHVVYCYSNLLLLTITSFVAVGWSELKEVLRVKSHAEVAKILLDYC